MLIRIKAIKSYWDAPPNSLGFSITREFPIMKVTNKKLFFLSVIKYAIEYEEIKQ